MKRFILSLVLLICATGLFAQTIVGSPHDMSLTSGFAVQASDGGTFDEVCVFCHTPHHAIGTNTGGGIPNEVALEPIASQLIPLWNHEPSTTTFLMYNNANNPLADLQGTVDATPGSNSLACLSCHDGTLSIGDVRATAGNVAIDTFVAGTDHMATDAAGLMLTTAAGYIGRNLTNDHPISITYEYGVGGDAELNDPTGLTGVELFPTNADGSKVECASCHDAHHYGTAAAGTIPFLKTTNANSAMCLQCHNK